LPLRQNRGTPCGRGGQAATTATAGCAGESGSKMMSIIAEEGPTTWSGGNKRCGARQKQGTSVDCSRRGDKWWFHPNHGGSWMAVAWGVGRRCIF
jgi:hypothetical protein